MKSTQPDLVEALQELIQLNLDDARGYRELAQGVHLAPLADLLRVFARERRQQAADLAALVSLQGEEPREHGSLITALHRAWVELLSAVHRADPRPLIEEAQRGELKLLEAYDCVLEGPASDSSFAEVLRAHRQQVREGRERLQRLVAGVES